MSIANQDHSFHKILELMEEAADEHGTQVVYVDDCDGINSEAPQFYEKFIIYSYGRFMIPVTINGEEW